VVGTAIVAFAEPRPGDPGRLVGLGIGAALVVVGVTVLSHSPLLTGHRTAEPEQPGRRSGPGRAEAAAGPRSGRLARSGPGRAVVMTQLRPGTDGLAGTVQRWFGRPVLVVGDVLLDEWRFTEPRRLSREAPAPVVTLRRQEDAAGGAGNTAVNLAALGARPTLVGPRGDDAAGQRLRARLAAAGVTDRAVVVPGHHTPVRRRVVAADQILLCEQEQPGTAAPAAAAADVVAELERALATGPAPVLAICDYGLGALDERVRGWLLAHRDAFALVALDAHELDRWAGLGPDVVTPSYAEARPLLGAGAEAENGRASAAVSGGPRLLRETGARTAAVTLDASGAVVLTAGGSYRTRSRPAPPSHCVGAGDAYLAAMLLALTAGADVPVAAELAQLAATATVDEPGTCVCSRAALLDAVGPGPADPAAMDAAELVAVLRRRRERGARIVFTNGCFDVLHRGHVGYLTQARELGDVLVVAVNSDESVRRLKGPQRPVNHVEDRVAVLAALACVDHVVVFEEDSPAALIEAIRPDVYVKGGDYPPELVPEAPLVHRLHGEVRTLGYVPDRSTSAIIDRIRSRAPAPDGTP
jgi:rfaE bifunctional protein nucleotidyltransferase chain/domain/rfaE bifunctional protein kinase chain/domain